MQAIADDPGGAVFQEVVNSLMDMERLKPGSSELLVTKLLQQLARFISISYSCFSFLKHT